MVFYFILSIKTTIFLHRCNFCNFTRIISFLEPSESSSTASTKKARQFDFDAMFKETVAAAAERKKETERTVDDSDVSTGSATIPKSVAISAEDEDEFIGPPIPGVSGSSSASTSDPRKGTSDDEEEEEFDEDEIDDEKVCTDYFSRQYISRLFQVLEMMIPMSCELTLEHGTKPVSAMAFDTAGARWATGGYDYDVKLWDFAGMDSAMRSFRTLQPCER